MVYQKKQKPALTEVQVRENLILEITRKKINDEEFSREELEVLSLLGDSRKAMLFAEVPSTRRIKKAANARERGEDAPDPSRTPEQVVAAFKKALKGMKQQPHGVTFVGDESETVEEVKQKVPEKKTLKKPIKKAVRVYLPQDQGQKKPKTPKKERPPMVWNKKPNGRHSNVMFVKFREDVVGRRNEIVTRAEAILNGRRVWIEPDRPLKNEDLYYLRPVVIPWGEEAKFSNVFKAEVIEGFSQEKIKIDNEEIIIVRSPIIFNQDALKKKGSVAVLFGKNEFTLVHVEDRKLMGTVKQAIDVAQKEEFGSGNSCKITKEWLIRLPNHFHISDEKVLEVLETALRNQATVKTKKTRKFSYMSHMRRNGLTGNLDGMVSL